MNWERHFRNMKPRAFDYGSIGGVPTVAELRDLLEAHQYSIDQTEAAFNAHSFELSRKDPTAYVLWLNDWRVLKARWNAARAKAEALLNESRLLPDNASPAGPEYVGVLKAIQLSYPELRTSPGDLVDMVSRLTKMGAKPDLSGMPQPKPDSDFDLGALQLADKLQQAATPSKKTWIVLGVAAGVGLLLLPKVLIPFK